LRTLFFLRRFALLALAAALSAAAPPAKSDKVLISPPPAAAAARAEEPRPAIWLLADHDTRIYLFGTVHILPPGFKWRSPAIDRIIAEADELVVETYEAPGLKDHVDAHQAMLLDKPTPILFRVPENRRKSLKAAIQATRVPIKYFDRLQTWAAAFMLGMAQLLDGYGAEDADDAPGVEDVLEASFRAAGKPIGSVEQPGDVVDSLNAIPADQQAALLIETIGSPPGVQADEADEDRMWVRGEVDAMAEHLLDDLPPALIDALLRKRNQAWTGWLAGRLDRPGTVLFAVGAGHLGGKHSVREMLAARGFAVKRIN
jgi:uncharacterized protein YbaP (TraB family)